MIALARLWGIPCTERRVAIREVLDAQIQGQSVEVFGTGTAAVISPVGIIKFGNEVVEIGDNEVGPVTERFYKELTDIQYGRAEDPLGWIEPVC